MFKLVLIANTFQNGHLCILINSNIRLCNVNYINVCPENDEDLRENNPVMILVTFINEAIHVFYPTLHARSVYRN